MFELGQYGDCVEAIKRAWERLAKLNTLDQERAMALKLATRFAKSVYQDKSLVKELEAADDIARYVDQYPNSSDAKVQEMKRWWVAARKDGAPKPPNEDDLRRAQTTPIFKYTEPLHYITKISRLSL